MSIYTIPAWSQEIYRIRDTEGFVKGAKLWNSFAKLVSCTSTSRRNIWVVTEHWTVTGFSMNGHLYIHNTPAWYLPQGWAGECELQPSWCRTSLCSVLEPVKMEKTKRNYYQFHTFFKPILSVHFTYIPGMFYISCFNCRIQVK